VLGNVYIDHRDAGHLARRDTDQHTWISGPQILYGIPLHDSVFEAIWSSWLLVLVAGKTRILHRAQRACGDKSAVHEWAHGGVH
jgi:hypothetical protein